MRLSDDAWERLLSLGSMIWGLLCGGVSLLFLGLCLLWLSSLLPLPNPRPARYYALSDYVQALILALAATAIVRARWRQSRPFALGFGLAAAAIVLLDVLLTAIGLDGSWYIP